MKGLIVNADDFGWDVDTVASTINLFEARAISSATIMVGRLATESAIEYAVRSQNRFSIGLHFNIVDGLIPATGNARNSLTGEDGTFRVSNSQRIRAIMGML